MTVAAPMAPPPQRPRSRTERFLAALERAGNALPHPAALFAIFAGLVLLASAVAAWAGLSAVHPGTGERLVVSNLLTRDGLHRVLREMVDNFTGFAPLGTVLVAMLGIGVAEASGLIGAGLRLLVLAAPRRLLTFVIVLAGVLSNTASEVGYVLLVPLGAMIFHAAGRHPIAGLAAAFAGVSGGYSANLLLGTIDPLLAGLTQEAAQIVDPAIVVSPACNYWFMAASTPLVALVGTWVTERVVVPRLGPYESGAAERPSIEALTAAEKRGLKVAALVALALVGLVAWGLVPENGFLRHPETGGVLHSPFMDGIVAFIFLGAALLGIAYGLAARTLRSAADVMNGMGKAMETLGLYLVICFFAAQFVAWFGWSNLGIVFAVHGAAALEALGLPQVVLLVFFVVLVAGVNLVMGSASAKWAVLAPVFVPMFLLVGTPPEVVQAAYRVGDSVTNIVSPMMSYFPLIVAFIARYRADAGIGTVIATMLPYTLAFLVTWTPLLVAWLLLGLPVGPA
jgi:aminobenzoyl-glutamate transport protein